MLEDWASWPGAAGSTSSFEVGTDRLASDLALEKPRCQNARLTDGSGTSGAC